MGLSLENVVAEPAPAHIPDLVRAVAVLKFQGSESISQSLQLNISVHVESAT
jgi:hypothetical protein